jgi:phenylacetate-CoA ligase
MALHFFPNIEDFSSIDDVLRFGLERRFVALRHAQNSPFYSRHLPQSTANAADWARVPLTTKQHLRNAYPLGLLATDLRRVVSYHESSGTSGEPTPSFLTENDWAEVTSRFLRNGANLTEDDVVMVKTPYSMVSTAHQMHMAAQTKKAMVLPADNRSHLIPYRRVVRLLRDLKVTVSWSLPYETLLWAQAARLLGHAPESDFPALRALIVAGEPLPEGRRQMIERSWRGARVWQDYGSTETCTLAGECKAGCLHFWADRFFPEILNPHSGEVEHYGTGELVVTSLFAEAAPLVRYNVGDWVTLRSEPCSCGWPLPRIEIKGRSAEAICIGNTQFLPSELEDAVSAGCNFELVFWRAKVQTDHLEIQYETLSETDCAPGIEHEVARRLGVATSIRRSVSGTIVPTEALLAEMQFAKPRLVIGSGESWVRGSMY